MAQVFKQIDGSQLEGGGQILRISIALSSLLNKPVEITRIRAGRPRPGLASQHLQSLLLARNITKGELIGGEIGSTNVRFIPKTISSGTFNVDTKTAGSITLILQTVIPVLIFSRHPTCLKLRGGTHVPFAPFLDFYTEILPTYLPFLSRSMEINCEQFGFYPKGRGRVICCVEPLNEQPLSPINWTEFGQLTRITGFVLASGTIPESISMSNAESAREYLSKQGLFTDVDDQSQQQQQGLSRDNRIRIEIEDDPYTSDGIAIMLVAHTTTGCRLSSSVLASKDNLQSNQCGEQAAKELVKQIRNQPAVDQYIQDQLIIYMALASGTSRITTGEITLHTKTAISVVESLTDAEFTITPMENGLNLIETRGIGYTRDQYYFKH